MKEQFNYFKQDVRRILGKYKIRILHIWLSRVFIGILFYRIERTLFLILGKKYELLRVLFVPFLNIIQMYSNLDINYKADIKGGIMILHPSVGIVISGYAIIGSNLTLTGGNVIGGRKRLNHGDILIGNNCNLGANAVILDPVKISNNINVGSLACVIKDCLIDNSTLVGVPAREI